MQPKAKPQQAFGAEVDSRKPGLNSSGNSLAVKLELSSSYRLRHLTPTDKYLHVDQS